MEAGLAAAEHVWADPGLVSPRHRELPLQEVGDQDGWLCRPTNDVSDSRAERNAHGLPADMT